MIIERIQIKTLRILLLGKLVKETIDSSKYASFHLCQQYLYVPALLLSVHAVRRRSAYIQELIRDVRIHGTFTQDVPTNAPGHAVDA